MKIFIFGPPGSGKSTLAFEIQKRTNLPLFHLDHFFFKAPNIHVPTSDALKELWETLPNSDWIVEGNHGAPLVELASCADYIFIIHESPIICAYRVLKRYFQNDSNLKRAISEGFDQTPTFQFLKFVLMTFPRGFKKQIEKIIDVTDGKVFHVKDVKKVNLSLYLYPHPPSAHLRTGPLPLSVGEEG